MCNQYSVRSFPKLLFFKNGVLTGKFHRERTPELIAGYFAKWSEKLPRAIPSNKHLYRKKKATLLTIPTLSSLRLMQFPAFNASAMISQFVAHLGPSGEPIIGSYEGIVNWDVIIYMISAVYALLRLLHYIRFRSCTRNWYILMLHAIILLFKASFMLCLNVVFVLIISSKNFLCFSNKLFEP